MAKVLKRGLKNIRKRFSKRRTISSDEILEWQGDTAVDLEQHDTCVEEEGGGLDGWIIITIMETTKHTIHTDTDIEAEGSDNNEHSPEESILFEECDSTNDTRITLDRDAIDHIRIRRIAVEYATMSNSGVSESLLATLIPVIRAGFSIHDRHLSPIVDPALRGAMIILVPAWHWSRLGFDLAEAMVSDYLLQHAWIRHLKEATRQIVQIGVAALISLWGRVLGYYTSNLPKLSSRRRREILQMLADAQAMAF